VVKLPTMAYVVARRSGTWEIRESHSTVAGPRGRTLATFRTLTPEIVERARARSSKPLDPGELRKTALRSGAPVSARAPDRAAGELLGELTAGRRPRMVLQQLLLEALGANGAGTSDSARAAAGWLLATPSQRGETLRDLLLLADRLPASRALAGERFPRIRSTPA
jgi:hypothetical protein